MTRRRFYVAPEMIDAAGFIARLDEDEARHLREVLRLRVGDEAFVFDGAGREWRGVVTTCAKHRAEIGDLQSVAPAQPESPLELTLALGLLKGEKFDFAVQKATELGVKYIVPLAVHNAEVRWREGRESASKSVRWQRIALAAAKQSGRATVPQIASCQSFEDFVRNSAKPLMHTPHFMFIEREGAALAAHLPESETANIKMACAIVGPEGGWTDAEISLAQTAGWRTVTLGGRILRAETAALVAVTLLQHRLGDLR